MFSFLSIPFLISIYLLFFNSLVPNNEAVSHFSFATNDSLMLLTGKKNYELLQKQSMNYGECWKNAISKLHEGCRDLSDEVQGRLALDFTNCFLEKIDYKTYPCDSDTKLSACLKDADMKAFSSYTEFFTHTQTICFYLQNQIWQENAQRVISDLTYASFQVSELLTKSKVSQEEMLKLQQISIDKQQSLILSGEHINKELETSKQSVKDFFNEVKDSAAEQRLLIFDVFEKINQMQKFFLGELTGFYTVGFYFIALVTLYLLTTTTRTNDARFILYTLIVMNVFVEKLITEFYLRNYNEETHVINELIISQVWTARKICSLLCLITLVWFWFTFKDYNVLNNKILNDIHSQNMQIINALTNEMSRNFSQLKVEDKTLSIATPFTNSEETTLSNSTLKQITPGTEGLEITNLSIATNGHLLPKPVVSRSKSRAAITASKSLYESSSNHSRYIEEMEPPIQAYEGRYLLRSRSSRSPSVESSVIYAAVSLKSKRVSVKSNNSRKY